MTWVSAEEWIRRAGGKIAAAGRRTHFLILLLAFGLARIPVLLRLDHLVIGWRPPDNAGIALNFYRYGFHLLYPQVNWGGNGPGYVEMEFPIVQYVTALLYKVFGVHEFVCLILPLLSGVGTVLVLYLLCARLYGPTVGLLAGIFAALSPTLSAYSILFYTDPAVVFFAMLGLYSWLLWYEGRKIGHFFLSALSVSLAALIKPTGLWIGFPILFVAVAFDGWRFLSRWSSWAYVFIVISLPALWYYHAHQLFLEYHNTFGVLSGGMLKTASADLILSGTFYVRVLQKLAIYQGTPLVMLMACAGLLVRHERRLQYLFFWWGVSLLVYILGAARGVDSGNQYLLIAVPLVAGLAAIGVVKFAPWVTVKSRSLVGPAGRVLLGAGIGLLFLGSVIASTVVYHRHDFWGAFSKAQLAERSSGLLFGQMIPPDRLIIVMNPIMNPQKQAESMTPPDIFYFADRRGWYLAFAWASPDEIEKLREEGACYAVVSSTYVGPFRTVYSTLYSYLVEKYTVLLDSPEGLVVNLCDPRPGFAMTNAQRAALARNPGAGRSVLPQRVFTSRR